MKKQKYIALHSASPLRLFFFLLLALFGSELFIMLVILPALFGKVEGFVANITDSFLLTLMIAPCLWIGVVRPLRHANLRLNDELKKKAEQLLDAQEELVRKEKLAVLGRLAGGVGHELRNPLGVMGNAVYFLKTVMTDADGTVKEYLDIIRNEINNSNRIISDLLDFSRTKTPQIQAVAVNELINQGVERCAVPEGISVTSDIHHTLPPIKVDPFQMDQVFQNLITNAFQAMPEGGNVRISARLAGAGLAPARAPEGYPQGAPLQEQTGRTQDSPLQDFVEISVSDTGEGISPENMKKLFQPLFTTKANGIGLGLVVCKNLVEANGGRIEVESQQGKGTTFAVALPAG